MTVGAISDLPELLTAGVRALSVVRQVVIRARNIVRGRLREKLSRPLEVADITVLHRHFE